MKFDRRKDYFTWEAQRRWVHCAGVEFTQHRGGKKSTQEFWLADVSERPYAVAKLAAVLLHEDSRLGRVSLDHSWVELRIRCAEMLLRK